MKIFSKAVIYSRMIRFSHTLFALPFALGSVVLVRRVTPLNLRILFWIIVAMVGARSAAMGFNRLADASIDAKNPRTAVREIPLGTLSRGEAALFVLVSSFVFVLSAALLSPIAFGLSFVALAVFFIYSYTKRFTWLSHFVLGLAIGMVPNAVWIAVTGEVSFKIGLLGLALLTHIAGFDILYACQDTEFDNREGLYSIPSRFGIPLAMHLSTLLHVISVICLLSLYWLFSFGPIYLFFVVVIAVLFFIEHRLVSHRDLSRINMAFFHVNSIISILVFVAILFGEMLRG
jgi:4-hydroxybenzoate polyprenyltransferase